jgi:hypothetical protein
MQQRHLAAAALVLTLAVGACGEDDTGPRPAGAPKADPAVTAVTVAVPTTAVTRAAAGATVRTDDLDAELQAVDRELSEVQQSVNHANDTSPDRADD